MIRKRRSGQNTQGMGNPQRESLHAARHDHMPAAEPISRTIFTRRDADLAWLLQRLPSPQSHNIARRGQSEHSDNAINLAQPATADVEHDDDPLFPAVWGC